MKTGKVKKVWTVSPDENKKSGIPFSETGGTPEFRIPEFAVYLATVPEKTK